ncbi:MAG: HAD family hydrolase [Gammaproteobacteria bacterium]|nr:HAD family hydrolase [Gammaproteobacteria bacterium]
MKNTTLKALIFDVDGTLADTERDGHRVAFNAAFREYGIDWDWDVELYGKLLAVTGGKERMRFCVSNFLGNDNLPDNFDDLIPELHAAKTRHYTELLATGAIPLRPGVERLLHEARENGLRLAVATTTTPENVTALFSHTLGEESLGWFDIIAAGDVVPAKKPAGDIYNYALEAMGLRPEECLAFEDSRNGILSSQDAGLTTLITVNGYTQDDDFSGAAVVLDHLGEPAQPFNVLAGDAHGHSMVNCELLEKIHAKNNA